MSLMITVYSICFYIFTKDFSVCPIVQLLDGSISLPYSKHHRELDRSHLNEEATHSIREDHKTHSLQPGNTSKHMIHFLVPAFHSDQWPFPNQPSNWVAVTFHLTRKQVFTERATQTSKTKTKVTGIALSWLPPGINIPSVSTGFSGQMS